MSSLEVVPPPNLSILINFVALAQSQTCSTAHTVALECITVGTLRMLELFVYDHKV